MAFITLVLFFISMSSWPSITELEQFYETESGKRFQAAVSTYVQQSWKQVVGEIILGIGYSSALLTPFISHLNYVFTMMPSACGISRWPEEQPNRAFLAEENALPIAGDAISRILVIHTLEYSHDPAALLEEIWRILAPGGRVCIIAPHRFGLWARNSATPFARGTHFMSWQLVHLLKKSHFHFLSSTPLLFSPPSFSAPAKLDKLCLSCCPLLGGMLVVEAEKRLYGMTTVSNTIKKPLPLYIPITTCE